MKNQLLRNLVAALTICIAFSACNSIPDHAKYIPKDAVAVIGINTKEIGKKVMWDALMGSKLIKDMKEKNIEKTNALEGLENSGIKGFSTSYIYVKPDQRFVSGARITALIPLDDAAKWEAYIKKTIPSLEVKTVNGRKEANVGYNMYAGWSNDLLIVMNTIQIAPEETVEEEGYDADTIGTIPDTLVSQAIPAQVAATNLRVDETQLSAEVNNAFTVSKENALTTNKRFTALEKEGHDISLWVNYEVLMGQYMNRNMAAMTGGFGLSNTMWKDAAATSGFDFEKGMITGDMNYYVSEELKQAVKEMGKDNADKEMLKRLPKQNLDMLMAMHLSPKGLKMMLEKMGVLGFANLALSGQGISTDDFFDAFTGDMAISMTDFSMTKETMDIAAAPDTLNTISMNNNFKTDINYVYALKINNKDKFKKLLRLAIENKLLTATGPNSYKIFEPANPNSPFIMNDDNYFVIANKEFIAQDFISGKYSKDKETTDMKVVYGHPFGFYFDLQAMGKAVSADIADDSKDAAILNECKKLLKDVSFSGGEFKNDALSYKMSINFLNKDESSILLLMDFAGRVDAAAN